LQPLLLSTGLVALAEMGDKTQLLSLVLAARLRKPWPICAGELVATLLNHGLAGGLGYWLAGSIPHQALVWVTGLSFIGFGLWTLHPDALNGVPKVRRAGAFVTTVIAFFIAEMGDKTQLATVALAAHFQAPLQVILGTTLGMLLADVPAIWLGDKLAQYVPMKPVRITAAVLFVAIGLLALLGALRQAA
jgi:putative Ca2+/H+ antiporter (TMEM165/GDT1 family)